MYSDLDMVVVCFSARERKREQNVDGCLVCGGRFGGLGLFRGSFAGASIVQNGVGCVVTAVVTAQAADEHSKMANIVDTMSKGATMSSHQAR